MFRIKKETLSQVSLSHKYILILGFLVVGAFFAWQTKAEETFFQNDINTSEPEFIVINDEVFNIDNSFPVDESLLPNPFPFPIDPNNSPVAEEQTVLVNEDQIISIELKATDADGDTLSYFIDDQPDYGVLTLEPSVLPIPNDHMWVYTPNADFNGFDFFTFYVKDGTDKSNIATVKINVLPINDNPIANDDFAETDKVTSVKIYSLKNDKDIDGDDLSISEFSQPANGRVVLNVPVSPDPTGTGNFAYNLNADTLASLLVSLTQPYFTYFPDGNFMGVDFFEYKVSDGNGGYDTAVVKINVKEVSSNNVPVGKEQNLKTDKNVPLGITLEATDADGDDLYYEISESPIFGTLSLMAIDGFDHTSHYIYRPNTNFVGNDVFSFIAKDGESTSDPVKVYISVGDGVTVVTPVANPGSGSYTSVQNVSLTAIDASQINYTTDGTNPTCDTGNVYVTPINVNSSLTIKAIACYPYDYASEVAVFTYNINIPTPPSGGGGGGGFFFGTQVLGTQETADCTEIGNYPAGSFLAQANQVDATVYYIGVDCKRYVFPDANTYMTWLSDWGSVEKVSVATLDSYEEANQAVTYRPGTKFVTHIYTNKVYAVEPRGTLRWIPTQEVGDTLYGAGWMTKIQDVLPFFFSTSYIVADQNLVDKFPTGTLVKAADESTVYYIENGYKRAFATGAFAANGLNSENIITTNVAVYPNGTPINGLENTIADVLEGRDQ